MNSTLYDLLGEFNNFDIILNRHLDKIKSPEIGKLVRKADD